MKQYLQLLRVHHWIKNIIIFIPLFFNTNEFINVLHIKNTILGFICFSLLSSIVYIQNDMRDIEKDRLHSSKSLRPLASGKIPQSHAFTAIIILSVGLIVLLAVLRNISGIGLLCLYLLLNIAYSRGLKNIPIVDVTILASGYVIRVLFGAMLIGVEISVWLYLVITMGAYYLGLGKRKNEISSNEKEKRTVIQFYSYNFLNINMYMCQALCVVFYALWSIDSVTIEKFQTSAFIYTIPFIFIILLKYSLNVETKTEGDPTSVVLGDRVLLLLCAAYIICAFAIIHLTRIIS